MFFYAIIIYIIILVTFDIMKLRHALSIMLIGMISLTAFATTSKLEQEPKATNSFDHSVSFDVVNVETLNFVTIEASTNHASIEYTRSFTENANVILNTLTHLDDVGWTDSRINYNLNLQSKAKEANRELNKQKDVIRIRNDS